jgi:mannose-6-phosphate isomerase-like protein (cupin superfamily)
MTNSVQFGNASDDPTYRGWLIGHFVDQSKGLRHSDDIELKWAHHPRGEERPDWVTKETRTSVSILVSGKWEMIFQDQSVTLSKPGDYVMWGPGTDHKWRALEDTVLLTVRWPSVEQ